MKDPLSSLAKIANNIASGSLIPDDLSKNIEEDSRVQKGKVDVFMQATTAYQTQRMAKYMQAASHLEDQVLDIEFMSNLPPEDKIKLLDMMQKHSESMIKFIDSKSSNVPERVTDITVTMDNRSVAINENQATGLASLNKLGSAGRTAVRNVMSVLEEKLNENPPEITVEPEKKKKRIIKRKKSSE